MNTKKEWCVLYQGLVYSDQHDGNETSTWKEGIQQSDLTLQEAHEFCDELNDKNTDFEFWVAHETSPDVQKHF